MRVLVQRVSRAQVLVEGRLQGAIGPGLVLLVGIRQDDAGEAVRFCAEKCANLRIFPDEEGKLNRSALEAGGAVLAISQFTLYGDCRRGRRPSFTEAAPPERAEPLYEQFLRDLGDQGLRVERGVFGAEMSVEILNEGPVTLLVESP
ncbi:MAG: D-tyrosyl-tRNA(Tyr) deacylase [Candidatus Handelsmanbacteria bacterium]|nr:D-tyrosyl-tRNA(Tyr) deacylase [Candidatus Handelsmanbacteria bacterium]